MTNLMSLIVRSSSHIATILKTSVVAAKKRKCNQIHARAFEFENAFEMNFEDNLESLKKNSILFHPRLECRNCPNPSSLRDNGSATFHEYGEQKAHYRNYYPCYRNYYHWTNPDILLSY